jgi:hypothetical protein
VAPGEPGETPLGHEDQSEIARLEVTLFRIAPCFPGVSLPEACENGKPAIGQHTILA